MRRPAGLGVLRREVRAARLSLGLLLGRRLPLFLALDLLVLGVSLLEMMLESEVDPSTLWSAGVLFPLLALAVPALAGVVDVERRAGCLDLALSAPAAEAYFLRRAGAVVGAMTLQGWAIMALDWIYEERKFPLLTTFFHVPLVCLFVGAAALFWAVRLQSAGAVWLATLVTAALAGRWLFASPIPDHLFGHYGAWLPGPEEALAWLRNATVLATLAFLLTLYARRRLRRPELMIS